MVGYKSAYAINDGVINLKWHQNKTNNVSRDKEQKTQNYEVMTTPNYIQCKKILKTLKIIDEP